MNTATKKKIFDAVLAEALEECLDKELKEFEEIELDEPHEFSPQYKKKMRKIINSVGRKERIKKFKTIVIRTAVSLAAAFGLIFGFLLTQPEVYAAVQNVIRSIFDEYDKYEYVGEELTVDNFDNNIRLGYIPDGYYLSEGIYFPAYVMLTYTNGSEKIRFKYAIAEGLTSYYDNEHNSYDNFFINGIEYHYYISNDEDFMDTLVWYEDGYSFGILAHLSKDELVKIAENIK